MTVTNILSEISRSDVYPLKDDVSLSGNSFYLSMKIDDWTEQMYKELPSIRFSIYVNYGSLYFLYKTVDVCFNTEEYNGNYSLKIMDTPDNFVLYVEPLFDNNAVSAHNNLVETGIIDDSYWNTTTNTFPITIDIINSEGKPEPEPSPVPDDCPFTVPDLTYFVDSAVICANTGYTYAKLNDHYAIGMFVCIDTGIYYTIPLFISPIADAVGFTYNETALGSFDYEGVTWYYSGANYAEGTDDRDRVTGLEPYPDILSWVNNNYVVSQLVEILKTIGVENRTI